MSEYKLAAFDMDGTLLDSKKNIRKDSLDALQRASDCGKILCMLTGRNEKEIDAYKHDLCMMDYFLCISGALVFDNKKGAIIYSKSIDHDTVLKLFEISHDVDAIIHIHSDESRFQPQDIKKLKDYGMGVYTEMFSKICTFHNNLEESYKRDPFPVYKFNFYCKNEEAREYMHKVTANLPIMTCHAETLSFECTPPGISKASGMTFICKREGIDIMDTIAVGDADNDLDMLQAAGLGVAMGNANENAKAAADVIVADCDSNGIEETIDKYLIGNQR